MADPRNTGTFADSVEQLPELAPVKPTGESLAPLPSLSETYTAARTAGRADRTDFDLIMIRDGYAPIVEALGLNPITQNPAGFSELGSAGAHGEPMLQSSDLLRQQGRGWLGSMTNRQKQEQLIAEQIRARRAKDPKFLAGVPDTVAGLRAYFLENEKKKRSPALQTLERSEGLSGQLASLAGSAVEGFHDPLNIATLPIGGGGKTVFQVVARETLVNGFLEALQQPIVAANRDELGEELTLGEAAGNVAVTGLFGGLLEGGIHVGGKLAGKALSPVAKRAIDKLEQARAARSLEGAKLDPLELFAELDNRELSALTREVIGEDQLSPDERAAIAALTRDQEIGEASPFKGGPAGDATHGERLGDAINDLIDNRRPTERPVAPEDGAGARATGPERPPAGFTSPVARPQGSGALTPELLASYKAKNRTAESGGNDRADNARSSAQGRFQITDGTWKSYHRRLFGSDGLEHKFEGAKQEAIMDALTRDNAARLQSIGEAVSEGNLYLMHFAGEAGGARILRADPDTPIERLLDPKAIAANPFLKDKSASEVVAWAHKKMGGSAASVPSRGPTGELAGITDEDPRIAQLRDEALKLDDQIVGLTRLADGTPVNLITRAVPASAIGVDATRFQFKAGGDEFGVTDRLKGIKEFDNGLAGRVTLWEDEAGKLWIADGHQRHGLARRISAESGSEIHLDAMVLRSRDGISAEEARVWAALKNIAEGSGSSIDAAKVLRDAGDAALERLPPKSPLVRDGAALARLSDEAFGAVYNERIPADQAAVIGHLLPDNPETHAAMVDLLIKLDPANRAQAHSIVRQAIAAGFHEGEQIDLFGTHSTVASLFAEKAKILERGLARLRKMRLVHKTAANEADELEAKGSKIARAQSEKEAQANAEAAAIIDRLAYRAGPVADALGDAARELANGGRLGDAADRFVTRIRELDLNSLDAGDRGGDDAGGIGREGDGGEADPSLFEEPTDPRQPSLIELEAATERFSDPDGPAVRQQADSLIHDFKAAIEENSDLPLRDGLEDLSDEEVARILVEEVIADTIDAVAVKQGRALELDFEDTQGYDELVDELTQFANSDEGAGERDKIAKRVEKAIAADRIKFQDLAEPELVGPNVEAMKPSSVVPVPANPRKSADYAGGFIDQAEAKAKVESWKAEAERIGRESPPPPGTVILSLFDASGKFSEPYRLMGYEVIQLDIKNGHDLLFNMGYYLKAIEELQARGGRVAGVLAQPPCTTFAGSGARWWDARHNRNWKNAVRKMWGEKAAEYFDSPVEYNQFLVAATEAYIGQSKPDFFVMENPRGRIAKLNGLPKANLEIEPHHFGDAYTKNTFLYGKFNNELETANVSPKEEDGGEGSRMHKLRSNAEKDEGLRSLTPEGFAYAFALANRPGTEGRAVNDPGVPPANDAIALDRGAEVDPAIAERQGQEVALKAPAPLRAAGDVDQKGEIGLGLFDAADQPQMTFRMDEEGGEISAEDLLAELDEDEKAIAALRGCL